MRRVRVETSAGDSLCIAEVADGHWTRFRGLLGRNELPEGEALWIRPSSSIHTFFMKFPIDVVYLGDRNDVVKTCSRLEPGRLSFGGRGAKTVLELAPGALDRVEPRVGEQLVIRPIEETDGPSNASA